ncbi:histidine kinase [Campylobacter mucosalis]|uniref:sensor histidine kinase n=1 Tax=Campylobacter mucosalis TaxID=202 RepID=UPI0004D785C2|nr:HAMP domain-containing sensor histidine kinase [Campylobacter mucosalis]KEA45960.1 histidine kinase [Campylobacter mucosalis]
MLVAIISVMLYYYIRITIFEVVVQGLGNEAKIYAEQPHKFNPQNSQKFIIQIPNKLQTTAEVISSSLPNQKPYYVFIDGKNESFVELYYPLDMTTHLKLVKNTKTQSDIIDQILIDMLIVNATAIALVIFYALFLSRMLLVPIKNLSLKLGKLNEHFLQEIDTKKLPTEFQGLGNTINKLIGRIHTFVEYQKELFIGTAHELKTPLAVMKTKNEVTLLKPREPEKYVEALKSNNEAINGMNKMIGSILEIGRQEGAQFEEPVDIDMIGFLKKLGENFKILAHQESKTIELELKPEIFNLKLQPTLLTHVLQNFVQNAIKFSPPQGVIKITSRLDDKNFIIEVLDEGDGIDESKDLFAPFKRYGDKGGSGLGLFLAKGAAQALGGDVSIKNRADTKGAIATFILPARKRNN